MNKYPHRATKACPEDLYPKYQELEGAWGESINDHRVPRKPNYKDSQGNLYIVTSGVCTDRLLNRANNGTVERPHYDSEEKINLTEAQQASNILVMYSGVEVASPDKILAVIDVDPQTAVSIIGLIKIEDEN